MSDKKHYAITAIVLGSICAVSAGLISLVNLLTYKKIQQNEIDRVNAGIAEIFDGSTKILDDKAKEDAGLKNDYSYVVRLYTVGNEKDEQIGYAIRATGTNMYGKISLIAGFKESTHKFAGVKLVVDEQTYASTLEDKYIVSINNGGNIDEVNCGATYGAKLVRDMINEAEAVAKELWKE